MIGDERLPRRSAVSAVMPVVSAAMRSMRIWGRSHALADLAVSGEHCIDALSAVCAFFDQNPIIITAKINELPTVGASAFYRAIPLEACQAHTGMLGTAGAKYSECYAFRGRQATHSQPPNKDNNTPKSSANGVGKGAEG
jgi:hypothetical protein